MHSNDKNIIEIDLYFIFLKSTQTKYDTNRAEGRYKKRQAINEVVADEKMMTTEGNRKRQKEKKARIESTYFEFFFNNKIVETIKSRNIIAPRI